ncbi:uncharacterized, partial [Tachysurus ichikawai]
LSSFKGITSSGGSRCSAGDGVLEKKRKKNNNNANCNLTALKEIISATALYSSGAI